MEAVDGLEVTIQPSDYVHLVGLSVRSRFFPVDFSRYFPILPESRSGHDWHYRSELPLLLLSRVRHSGCLSAPSIPPPQ